MYLQDEGKRRMDMIQMIFGCGRRIPVARVAGADDFRVSLGTRITF